MKSLIGAVVLMLAAAEPPTATLLVRGYTPQLPPNMAAVEVYGNNGVALDVEHNARLVFHVAIDSVVPWKRAEVFVRYNPAQTVYVMPRECQLPAAKLSVRETARTSTSNDARRLVITVEQAEASASSGIVATVLMQANKPGLTVPGFDAVNLYDKDGKRIDCAKRAPDVLRVVDTP
jgi:hypothetical protein